MDIVGSFPFGQPVKEVTQQDRTPKKVFMLGLYAGPVYARWLAADGQEKARVLAVASEPEIFWRGEDGDRLVAGISIPPEAGRLVAAAPTYNGPYGRALDEQFLQPLGLTRAEAWLCYLVPHPCMSAGQKKVIARVYEPAVQAYGLPPASVPPVPKVLANDDRRQAILAEFEQSRADVLILLGEQPVSSFLSAFDPGWKRLANFEADPGTYGRPWPVTIAGRPVQALPLADPGHVVGLGRSVARWSSLHQDWRNHQAAGLKF